MATRNAVTQSILQMTFKSLDRWLYELALADKSITRFVSSLCTVNMPHVVTTLHNVENSPEIPTISDKWNYVYTNFIVR